MKKPFIIFIIILSYNCAYGTSQAPDILFWEEKEHALYSNPLESYFRIAGKPRYNFNHKKIEGEEGFFVVSKSSNWRGYIATWMIENDYLYLLKIVDLSLNQIDFKKLFETDSEEDKIKAIWFSGQLVIKFGKRLQSVHMGYGLITENEIIIDVDSGKVKNVMHIDNTKKPLPSKDELLKEEFKKCEEWGY